MPTKPRPEPDLTALCGSIMDLVDDVSSNLVLQALANVAGAVVVNASDNIIEAHEIAGRMGEMIRDTIRANWAAMKTPTNVQN